MRVVALVPGTEHVCTRYRIGQFADSLSSAGLKLSLEPLAERSGDRWRQLTTPRFGQVVLLVRKLLPIMQLIALRRNCRALVYDFDDAVYLRDSFHLKSPYSWTRTARFAATMLLANRVFAGNSHLASEAKRRGAGCRVHVVPTCIDATRYATAQHRDRSPTRLVWIGSSSTVKSLEAASDVFEAVGRSVPDTVFRVICDKFPHFEHLPVEQSPWSASSETTALAGSDIGISWLPDDRWTRGKCGLKVLQYMAAGLPVVANRVGVHAEMVGSSAGILADSPSEWVSAIRELSESRRLREELGRAARRRIETEFHVDTWGPVVAQHLSEVANRA